MNASREASRDGSDGDGLGADERALERWEGEGGRLRQVSKRALDARSEAPGNRSSPEAHGERGQAERAAGH